MILVSVFGWTRNLIYSVWCVWSSGCVFKNNIVTPTHCAEGNSENSIGADWGGHSRLPPTDSISVGVCVCDAYCRVTSLYICVTPHYRQATTAFWAYCSLKPMWYGIHNLFCFCQSANKYYFIFIVSSQILIPRCTDLSSSNV